MANTTRLAIGAALIGAAALGAMAVAYSVAQPGRGDEFSAAEQNAIRQIVRDYLLENPGVVIEAINEYAALERAGASARTLDAAKTNIAALLDPSHGAVIGEDAGAQIAVVELFDYHCGFCKRAVDLVQDLAGEDDAVKVVFRELPILRAESELAAAAALAARAQGKYADMHFALMNSSGVLTKERIFDIAESQGLDVAALEAEMESPAVAEAIAETRLLAQAMGIEGTPTFVIASLDGEFVQVVEGFRPDDVTNAIASAKEALAD